MGLRPQSLKPIRYSIPASNTSWSVRVGGWRRTLRVVVIGLLSTCAIVRAVAQNTALILDNDPDPQGHTTNYYFQIVDGQFSAIKNYRNGVTILYRSTAGANHDWELEFAAPGDAPLTKQRYNYATTYSSNYPSDPKFSVFGDGSACDDTGSFEVKEIVYAADGSITAFHAVFEQHCEYLTGKLLGEVFYQSSDALTPKAHLTSGLTAFATQGQFFKYRIQASNNPTHYTATNLPPGLNVNASTGIIFGTPTAQGTYAVSLFATDDVGVIGASGTLSMTVDPPGRSTEPYTALVLHSDPGNWVGNGQSYAYREWDGGFGVRSNSYIQAFFDAGFGNDNWDMLFSPQLGKTLAPGVYRGAALSSTATRPGLEVFGNGRGCTPSGSFEIKELTMFNETVVSFRATFVQYCDGGNTALRGELWFHCNSAITSNVTATAIRDTAFSFQLVANNQPTSYAASSLPPGLSVDPNSGIISGTPTVAGTFDIPVQATGATSTALATLRLIIAPPSPELIPAPVVSSRAFADASVTMPFNYQITATNNPTSYSASGLPSGLLIDSGTGLISGTPTTEGPVNAIVTASNLGGTGGSSLIFDIHRPVPVFTSAVSATGAQGKPFSFQAVASNQPEAFSADGLPNALQMDVVTGLISGTTIYYDTFNVVLSASNSGGVGSQAFTLTINKSPPIFTGPSSAQGWQGQYFSYRIETVWGSDGYGATGLPQGLSVDATSGFITGTPLVSGTFNVTLWAKNDVGENTAPLTLTIYTSSPSPTPSPTATPTATATATPGATATPSAAATATPTATATGTATPTATATATPTATAVPTATATASATAAASATATATPIGTPAAPGLVGNVSTRLPVGTGDNALIEGFIVQGPAGSTKKIMVRAIGPSLAGFGITDALANPTLEIHDSSGATVATNDDWRNTQQGGLITGDQSVEINSSGLAPGNDLESAIIANLAPGSYTAVVRGFGNSTGTGVVDAYDLSGSSPAQLANIATRGLVQGGDKLMIAGFIVQDAPVKTVIRAIGPSLSAFGITNALADTTLQLRDVNGAIVRENDNWKTDQKAELENTALQPTDDLEAALVETIPPGQYTAQVRGKNDSSGIGVVQVYFIQ